MLGGRGNQRSGRYLGPPFVVFGAAFGAGCSTPPKLSAVGRFANYRGRFATAWANNRSQVDSPVAPTAHGIADDEHKPGQRNQDQKNGRGGQEYQLKLFGPGEALRIDNVARRTIRECYISPESG